MVKRGLALTCVLGMASMAQAGASQNVELRAVSANPHNGPGVFNPGEEVMVDIFVTQDAGEERLLRLVHLHFDGTDGSLEPGLGALVWDSDSATHYQDTSRGSAAPGDPAGVATAYYFANPADLGPNPASQLTLPAAGEVRVATLELTLPMVPGDYLLDALTADSSVSFGYDFVGDATPITFWRNPGNLEDGQLLFTVTDVVTAWKWQSIGVHGMGIGPVALEIAPDPAPFSEPRLSGVSKLVVSYAGAFNPATAAAGAVTVVGNASGGIPVDLSGIVTTTNAIAANTQLEITFAPKLPDFAKYRITLAGVETPTGAAIAGTNSVIVTALLGDASGDLMVLPNDVGGVSNLVAIVGIDPTIVIQVRSDGNNDGNILPSDVGGISNEVGKIGAIIPNP